ncbi:aldose 1-epimerase [Peribacillus frigoritolerans]
MNYVERCFFLQEQPAIKLGNKWIEVIVLPDWGSNMISMVEKKTNKELLKVPTSKEEFLEKPFLYGTPILFPPNRIDNGCFTFNNRHYQFEINEQEHGNHIHGLVYNKNWTVKKYEANGDQALLVTEFNAALHPDVIKQFPHSFVIEMHFVLSGHTIEQTAFIKNNSEECFPWGLGYHTAFLFNEESSVFSLTAAKKWTLNNRFLPTGEWEVIPYKNELEKGMSLKQIALDDAFYSSFGEDGRNEAILYNESTGIEITYKADSNFKHWVVYNCNGQKGFVCPEPYTWITDAPNLHLPPDETGLQTLNPSEIKSIYTSISVGYR